MSMKNMGRFLRRERNCSPCSRRKMAWGEPVEVITMSARSQESYKSSGLMAQAVELLRQPRWRVHRCGWIQRWKRNRGPLNNRAASSLIFPAPTMKTVLPSSVPKIFLASSTATDAIETDDDPTAVSLRTRLADGEGTAEELVELSADGTGGTSGGIGFLNLAENLRLADYHRIQARATRNRWRTASFAAVFVEVRIEFRWD